MREIDALAVARRLLTHSTVLMFRSDAILHRFDELQRRIHRRVSELEARLGTHATNAEDVSFYECEGMPKERGRVQCATYLATDPEISGILTLPASGQIWPIRQRPPAVHPKPF